MLLFYLCFKIWNSKHCRKILEIIGNVFADIDSSQFNVDSDAANDDLFLNDWEDFLDDSELLAMAADNLFQESQLLTGHHEFSQLAEDSMFESNVTDLSDLGQAVNVSDVLSRINVSN